MAIKPWRGSFTPEVKIGITHVGVKSDPANEFDGIKSRSDAIYLQSEYNDLKPEFVCMHIRQEENVLNQVPGKVSGQVSKLSHAEIKLTSHSCLPILHTDLMFRKVQRLVFCLMSDV